MECGFPHARWVPLFFPRKKRMDPQNSGGSIPGMAGMQKKHLDVSENSGTPQIIHFNRVFHYKPSILGYPYCWKHPFIYKHCSTRISLALLCEVHPCDAYERTLGEVVAGSGNRGCFPHFLTGFLGNTAISSTKKRVFFLLTFCCKSWVPGGKGKKRRSKRDRFCFSSGSNMGVFCGDIS